VRSERSTHQALHYSGLAWVRWLAIALVALSIVFRFVNLDGKVYWHDEAYTSMVITARPVQYLVDDLFQNRLVSPADLLAYQEFVPGLSLGDMVLRKGLDDVQHPPVYYLLLRFWAQIWGTTPAVTRGFSALLTLLILPAVYWLCVELFESSLSGWVAIALFAVSPLHLVFGQEVREFGLWTVQIFVCSALLLRAIRRPGWRPWAWYGLSMAVAFYTALFTLGIAIGHGLYLLGLDRQDRFTLWPPQLGRQSLAWLGTMVGVAIAFIPWLYFVVVSRETLGSTTSWTSISLPWHIGLRAIAFNFSYGFFDLNARYDSWPIYLVVLPLLALQGYALYRLCQTAPYRMWWFVATLVGSTAILLGLPDLLLGGQRFTVTRYLIACCVGLQLAVVYLISTALTAAPAWQARWAKPVFALLIGLGIISCGVYAQADTWWNKSINSNYHQLGSVINQGDRPLVIADAYSYYPVSLISLSYLVQPDTQILLLPSVGQTFTVDSLPETAGTVFLFNLPEVFRQRFADRFDTELTLAFQDPWNEVWQSRGAVFSPPDPKPNHSLSRQQM
jgi:uncharacterized membrane protein